MLTLMLVLPIIVRVPEHQARFLTTSPSSSMRRLSQLFGTRSVSPSKCPCFFSLPTNSLSRNWPPINPSPQRPKSYPTRPLTELLDGSIPLPFRHTGSPEQLCQINRTEIRWLSDVFGDRSSRLHDAGVVYAVAEAEAVAEFVAGGLADAGEVKEGEKTGAFGVGRNCGVSGEGGL